MANYKRKLITLALIVILCIFFGISTDSFFVGRNVIQLLREAAYTGIIACGMCFIMVGGGIDLSAGGMMCLIGVVVARCAHVNIPGILVILIGLAAGMCFGAVNGLIVTKLHLTEFVTTLATGSAFRGLALLTTFREKGRVVSVTLKNDSFNFFGTPIAGIYWMTIAWVAVTIIMYIVMTRRKFGLYVMAMGSAKKAAEMSGVRIDRTKIMTFVIGGLMCGLAATLLVAYQTGTNQNVGNMMEFNAIAACVVGGVMMEGGKGDPLCACLGAILMTLITNGLYKMGLTTGGTYLLQGVVIVATMALDGQFSRLTSRQRALKASQ